MQYFIKFPQTFQDREELLRKICYYWAMWLNVESPSRFTVQAIEYWKIKSELLQCKLAKNLFENEEKSN